MKFSDNSREVLAREMAEALCSTNNQIGKAADVTEIVRILGTINAHHPPRPE
jgi:hypothetical protein